MPQTLGSVNTLEETSLAVPTHILSNVITWERDWSLFSPMSSGDQGGDCSYSSDLFGYIQIFMCLVLLRRSGDKIMYSLHFSNYTFCQ